MESAEIPERERVENLLSIFEGDEKVCYYYMDTKKYAVAPRSLWVLYDATLIRELKKLLGEDNVVYKL